jgi:hypothetical protein
LILLLYWMMADMMIPMIHMVDRNNPFVKLTRGSESTKSELKAIAQETIAAPTMTEEM